MFPIYPLLQSPQLAPTALDLFDPQIKVFTYLRPRILVHKHGFQTNKAFFGFENNVQTAL